MKQRFSIDITFIPLHFPDRTHRRSPVIFFTAFSAALISPAIKITFLLILMDRPTVNPRVVPGIRSARNGSRESFGVHLRPFMMALKRGKRANKKLGLIFTWILISSRVFSTYKPITVRACTSLAFLRSYFVIASWAAQAKRDATRRNVLAACRSTYLTAAQRCQ